MKIIGETRDGKKVVTEVFKLYDTRGLPLSIIFQLCDEQNLIPSWIDFYIDAIKAGWKDKTVKSRLKDEMSDYYSQEFTENVIKRLNEFINNN